MRITGVAVAVLVLALAAAGAGAQGSATIEGGDGAPMALVPAGPFIMGSDEHPHEKPRHTVYLDAYAIDRYEATNALYARFVDGTKRAPPGFWRDPRFNAAAQPVVGVTWYDADAYCRWARKRLPTEAEWEKAARGTDGRTFPWGNEFDASRAHGGWNRLGRPMPVGVFPTGVSPSGVHDMAGNVWEWVADWYGSDDYARSPARDPRGPVSGNDKVIRGGSWLLDPNLLRVANRHRLSPRESNQYTGFRCAKDASSAPPRTR